MDKGDLRGRFLDAMKTDIKIVDVATEHSRHIYFVYIYIYIFKGCRGSEAFPT